MKIALLVSLCAVGCATSSGESKGGTTPAAARKSLYERLGGKEAIVAVVGDFVANVGADARINAFFANADMAKLKAGLVDQIREASGGPCKYAGRDMKSAHAGTKIKGADFERWSRT